MSKSVVLIVLDGWGYREEKENNPIAIASTPCFDNLWANHPHSLLEASGLAVGLPDGQMGNSEVGHMTIGSGRVMDTDLVKISKAVEKNEFVNNPAFQTLFAHVKKHNSVLHVKGLLGSGGVHSHSEHLFAFLRAAKILGVEKIAIHVFLDGRDTAPQSAVGYLKELENVLEDLKIGFIATASGRFYAMDRDSNWERLAKAEEAIFAGKAGKSHQTAKPSDIISSLYIEGKTDEHIEPMVFLDETGKAYQVEKNDGLIFFNFRADRARMLSKKIVAKKEEMNLCFVTMTEYEKDLDVLVAFPPEKTETTLAAEISLAGLSQVHIAETEKFAHATYFLNGGRENPHEGEKHILVESRKDVPTYDLAPKMGAEAIADKAIQSLEEGVDFMFINFANPDMVGHTGNESAVIEAIAETDRQLNRVLEKVEQVGGIALVTADHGNAELSFDKFTNTRHTSHTVNPVPAILFGLNVEMKNGSLRDIAPTVLQIMNIQKPKSMTGVSLIN